MTTAFDPMYGGLSFWQKADRLEDWITSKQREIRRIRDGQSSKDIKASLAKVVALKQEIANAYFEGVFDI